MRVFNVNDAELKYDPDDPDGYRGGMVHFKDAIGARTMTGKLFELPPGQAAFPLHYHHANEELMIVLAGAPTLRTTSGERTLAPGDVVAFPRGAEGAHQIINRSDEPIRFFIVSEMNAPEIVVYPDSGKIFARDTPPGGDPVTDGGPFFNRDAVDYFEGEPQPE